MRWDGLIGQWPVTNAAAAVLAADGSVLARHGDTARRFPITSVTKLLTAYAALVGIEEGAFELDTLAGPEGSTVRDLLAHASGLAFAEHTVQAAPRTRRIYSSAGYEQLAEALAKHSGIGFAEYQREALLDPLGLASTTLDGSPGADMVSTVDDLAAFAAEVQRPHLLDPATVSGAASVVHPGLTGVLPGFGHQRPNDWGLGFEIRGHKDPHWTGSASSPSTYGHFGQSGTFLWIDPDAGLACAVLTDRDFGPWAIEAWPVFTDTVLDEFG